MKKLSKTKIILFGVIAVIVIVFTGFGVKNYLDRPQDLGPNLEYLGKRHTGCPLPLPLGYLLMCSTGPGEEYYFGTDMDFKALEKYFKNTELALVETRKFPQVEKIREGLYIEFRKKYTITYEGFRVKYYGNKESTIGDFKLKQTSKQYVLSIPSDDGDYDIARTVAP